MFAKNSKIQNGRHFWRDKIFLKIGMATLQTYPVGQKFLEIALSSTVFEIEAFLCLQLLRKIRKFKMAASFGERKFF